MEEIYVNVEEVKPVTSRPSTDQRGKNHLSFYLGVALYTPEHTDWCLVCSGPRSSERRCFGCAVLCLGLLSVLLLLGLIVIGFKCESGFHWPLQAEHLDSQRNYFTIIYY